MVSFWGAQKLSSYLVRAKLYPLERSVGSFKCNGNRCQVCMNMTESNTFSSSVVINHSFNCNDKCITYLFTCNKCKVQYVGKTVDDFHLRWNNYKDNNRKYLREESCMQQNLFEHFSSGDHNSFWMTSPLSLLIKLILKILTYENTTGDIALKQWNLKA